MNITNILPFLVLGSLFFLFFLWNIRSFFSRVSGVWLETPEQMTEVQEIQKIVLHQLGPFVWGRMDRVGGYQLFSGWFDGRKLTLKRKDYGKDFLLSSGFPKELIPQLHGTEMGKLEFEWNAQKKLLVGNHYKLKVMINFERKPPKIEEKIYSAPVEKKWKKMESI